MERLRNINGQLLTSHKVSPKKTTTTLADVYLAAKRIQSQVRYTPCRPSSRLTLIAGANVFLKLENTQFTGSYKERGALNKLINLTEEERRKGVCAASAGNHAQGRLLHLYISSLFYFVP